MHHSLTSLRSLFFVVCAGVTLAACGGEDSSDGGTPAGTQGGSAGAKAGAAGQPGAGKGGAAGQGGAGSAGKGDAGAAGSAAGAAGKGGGSSGAGQAGSGQAGAGAAGASGSGAGQGGAASGAGGAAAGEGGAGGAAAGEGGAGGGDAGSGQAGSGQAGSGQAGSGGDAGSGAGGDAGAAQGGGAGSGDAGQGGDAGSGAGGAAAGAGGDAAGAGGAAAGAGGDTGAGGAAAGAGGDAAGAGGDAGAGGGGGMSGGSGQAGSSGSACDPACADGTYCSAAGTCIAQGTCSVAADCGPGRFCSAGGICLDEGQCATTADCGPGTFCSAIEKCIPAGTCESNLDCDPTESCDVATKSCVFGGCGAVEVVADLVAPNMLFVVDRSCSMTDKVGTKTKWQIAVDSMVKLTTDFKSKINWGLTLFPDTLATSCAQNEFPVHVAPGTEQAIQTLLTGALVKADKWFPDGPCVTNIDTGMQQAQQQEPALDDATRKSYVVLITDGKQAGCNAAGGDNGTTAIINDLRVNRGVSTFVLGFGSGIDANQMNIWANEGGVPNSDPLAPTQKYYKAEDQASLDAVLANIAKKTLGCVYNLQQPPPDPDKVFVFFDNATQISKDPGHANGWDYEAAANRVTFYGQACQDLKDGAVADLDIVFGCPQPIQ